MVSDFIIFISARHRDKKILFGNVSCIETFSNFSHLFCEMKWTPNDFVVTQSLLFMNGTATTTKTTTTATSTLR